jgi:hypothetical protein
LKYRGTQPKGSGTRIYGNNRFLGTITTSYGYDTLISTFPNKLIIIDVPFMSICVNSIPTKAGVFGIDDSYGALNFETDGNIHYDIVGQTITWSAISVPTNQNIKALKTINSVHPIANNLRIMDSDLIKIQSTVGGIIFSLFNSILNDNISPSKNFET